MEETKLKETDLTAEMLKEAYEIAKSNRDLEIGLLWKRTTIFWGFLTILFVAVCTAKNPYLRGVLSIFGFVISVIWSFANRGSKSWQESYELRADELFKKLYNTTFSPYERIIDKTKSSKINQLYRPRPFSLSKLLMSVSDFFVIFWIGSMFWQLPLDIIEKHNVYKYHDIGCLIIFIILSLIYIIYCYYKQKSTYPGLDVEAFNKKLKFL